MTTFSDLGISKEVVRAMNEMNWTEPTPVQEASVPYGLDGGDMFAQAQTGTGKTGAYSSIILSKIQPGFKDPSALILTPTRELAIQVSEEIQKLSKYTTHDNLVVYGGVSINPQITRLKKGTDIIVGTPGRLKDLMNQGFLDLSWISIVVLDEADRMLDMGFIKDIEFILGKIPENRQTLMFSATMTPDIKRLAKSNMNNPKEFLVSKDEPVLDLITQYYVFANKDNKRNILRSILDNGNPRTIAFCQTKRKAGQIAKKMIGEGYSAAALHGDVPQAKREKTIKDFKNGLIDLLIATDVAARGLDIDDVEYVINFDMPDVPETYVHRIGRVGRAGKTGTSISFVLNEEKYMLRDIEKLTGKKIDLFVPSVDINEEYVPKNMPEVKKQVEKAPAVKKIAEKKIVTKKTADREKPETVKSTSKSVHFTTISMNLGADDGLTKQDVMDIIASSTDVLQKEIGSIVIGRRSTFVEVKCKDPNKFMDDLETQTFEGIQISVGLE